MRKFGVNGEFERGLSYRILLYRIVIYACYDLS